MGILKLIILAFVLYYVVWEVVYLKCDKRKINGNTK